MWKEVSNCGDGAMVLYYLVNRSHQILYERAHIGNISAGDGSWRSRNRWLEVALMNDLIPSLHDYREVFL